MQDSNGFLSSHQLLFEEPPGGFERLILLSLCPSSIVVTAKDFVYFRSVLICASMEPYTSDLYHSETYSDEAGAPGDDYSDPQEGPSHRQPHEGSSASQRHPQVLDCIPHRFTYNDRHASHYYTCIFSVPE